MFGIEFEGLLRLAIQLSIAIAGAASLWGCIHIWKQKKENLLFVGSALNPDAEYLTDLFQKIYTISFTLFIIAWAYGSWYFGAAAFAHEGIKLPVLNEYLTQGLNVTSVFVFLLALLTLVSSLIYSRAQATFYKYSSWLLGGQFVLASLIVSLIIWTGDFFSREQLFYIVHNWHSILTLASVIVVDVFFLFTWHKRKSLRKMIYNVFPLISAGIWLGLGLDFLSVWLILGEAWHVTHQFLFSQTLVGILIVNGALLSVRINDWLLKQVTDPTATPASPTWQFILGLSGAISIISWLSITFVDFFTIEAAYWQMIATWAALVIIAYISHYFMDKLMEKYYASKNRSETPASAPDVI